MRILEKIFQKKKNLQNYTDFFPTNQISKIDELLLIF